MERETKTVTTPEGKELVLKAYLIAKERNEYLLELDRNGLKNPAGENASDGSVVAATIKSAKKLFELVVASYDGSAEAIAERLENAKSDEYDFALKEAAGVAQGNFLKAK